MKVYYNSDNKYRAMAIFLCMKFKEYTFMYRFCNELRRTSFCFV